MGEATKSSDSSGSDVSTCLRTSSFSFDSTFRSQGGSSPSPAATEGVAMAPRPERLSATPPRSPSPPRRTRTPLSLAYLSSGSGSRPGGRDPPPVCPARWSGRGRTPRESPPCRRPTRVSARRPRCLGRRTSDCRGSGGSSSTRSLSERNMLQSLSAQRKQSVQRL